MLISFTAISNNKSIHSGVNKILSDEKSKIYKTHDVQGRIYK